MVINKNLTQINYNSGSSTARIKYIVMHYTGNNGDTAWANTNYFKSVNRGASAHYFVDENGIWQCVEDKDIAWHVGNDTYKHPSCRNNNSIGVEMCSRKDGDYYFKDGTVSNAAELVKQLMKKYGVPIENVIRHYDVTGKICPAPYVNNSAWQAFKSKLKTEVEDMTKAETQALIKEAVTPVQTKLTAAETKLATVQTELAGLKKTYKYIDDVPEWYREAVQYWINRDVLQGKGVKDGKILLDLTAAECRMLTMMYRAEAELGIPFD